MNVNKKFDRFRQWGREKMGAEVQTGTTEDFKALETEMNLRQEGMEKLHGSMGTYVKSLTRRTEGEGRDKGTPTGYMGQQMTRHGEDFEDGNAFGRCLASFGQANEKVANLQDIYAAQATDTWLAALDRGVAQMKEYQTARKRLDSRRLAFDTAQAKMSKAKRDDYRAEEEVRAQKAKFDESSDEVYRRMQDIVEAEQDNITDLYSFLEAEIAYHDKCREVLMNLRADWPNGAPRPVEPTRPSTGRSSSRNNALNRIPTNGSPSPDDIPAMPPRPFTARSASGTSTPPSSLRNATPLQSYDLTAKPPIARSTTTDLPSTSKPSTTLTHNRPPIPRIATEASVSRSVLRPVKRDGGIASVPAVYADDDTDESPDRSNSPVSSYGTGNGTISRNTSWSTLDGRGGATTGAAGSAGVKKAPPPPPPPPSRASKPKPPPPPPPMKRLVS